MFTPGAFARHAFDNTAFYVGAGVIEMTLADVMARVRAVCEASPLSMTLTAEAFSHDRQPTTLLDNTYYVDDGGLLTSKPMGNYTAARVDRLIVFVALKVNASPHTRKETLETTLLTIERQLKADGPPHGYHVEIAGSRRITQRKGTDFLIGSIGVSADYDLDEGT